MPDRATVQAGNVELVRAQFDLIDSSGLEALLDRFGEFFTEDAEWTSALTGAVGADTYRGREGFEAFVRDVGDAFGEMHWVDRHCLPVGDGVLLSGRTMARGRGSGTDVEREFVVFARVRDGRIYNGRSFISLAEGLRAAAAVAAGRDGEDG